MVFDDFKAELNTALGGNLIDVELIDADYEYAYNRAKRTFIQKGNNNIDRRFYSLGVIEGTTQYILPSEIDTITTVIKPRSGFTAEDPFSIAYANSIISPHLAYSGSASLITYELSTQLIENVEIYTADQPQFHYNKRLNTLTFLDSVKVTETWILDCYADLTDDEYYELPWIQEYALAECKIILGRAYGKFQSLSSPTGETSLNGDVLVQEGRDDQIRLIEEIGNYTDGGPIGSPILIG